MVLLELLSPSTLQALSPHSRATQENLQQELKVLQDRFPDAKKRKLTRFLMAYGMSAERATTAFEAHLKWQDDTLPVTRESVLKELRSGMFYLQGRDKEGRPVAYYSLAGHDPRNRDLSSIFRMMAYLLEQTLEGLEEEEDKGITMVWDTRHTRLRNTDGELMRELLAFFRAQYPKVLSRMLVCPVGLFQRGVWRMACRFLHERRAAAIVTMLPHVDSLREYIDPQELLATHGGKNPWTVDPAFV